jgi:hypothetical protein
MKTIQLFSFVALLFLTAFTTPLSSSIEIECEKDICGCDADFGSLSGIYQETKRVENGYPVYLGPNKDKSYEIRLKAETPKGADFTVYRWEIRTSNDELVYFDGNIKMEPFPFSETKGEWTAENSAFEPVPNKITGHF